MPMFSVVVTEKGGSQRRVDFDKNEVTIGRVQGNDVILPKGNVSKRHSRIAYRDSRFIVVDLKSTNGTYVNGRKITSPLVVKPGDKIYIGDFILTLEDHGSGAAAMPAAPESEPAPPAPPPADARARARPAPPPLRAPGDASGDVTAPPPIPGSGHFKPTRPESSIDHTPPPAEGERFALEEEPLLETGGGVVASGSPAARPAATPAAALAVPAPSRSTLQGAGQPIPSGLAPGFDAQRMSAPTPRTLPATQIPAAPLPPAPVQRSAFLAADQGNTPGGALRLVMAQLGLTFDTQDAQARSLHDARRWDQAKISIATILADMDQQEILGPNIDRDQVATLAAHEAVGLGPLDALLLDESVREILVEGTTRLSVDRGTGLQPSPKVFSSPHAVLTAARRLAASSGEPLDPARTVLVTTLTNGAHATIIQAPVAARGTIIQIRRTGLAVTLEELISRSMFTADVVALFRAAVKARRNIFVGGPIGVGVTTLLGALAGLFGEDERIITVSEAPDLAVDRPTVLSLCAGSSTAETSFHDILHQACRMRSDRLVVDDVGGGETFDVLTVVATRMPGALVGINTAHDRAPLAQIESLARLQARGNDLAITQLVASAVHLVVTLGKDSGGTHRVSAIAEITGSRGNALQASDLFVTESGALKATGKTASFV